MQETTTTISGLLDATGKLDDPAWTRDVPALIEISSLTLKGVDMYGKPQTLRFVCAPRAADPCTIDGRKCEHSHLILRQGQLTKGPDGNYKPAPGGQLTALTAFLHLPTPLSGGMRGYWLVIKLQHTAAAGWQVNLGESPKDNARAYVWAKGAWEARILRDLVQSGAAVKPVGDMLSAWSKMPDTDKNWFKGLDTTGHPLFNPQDGAILRIAKPGFGLGVLEDPDKPFAWEVVSYLQDDSGKADTLRELPVASLTGAPAAIHQPATLFHKGRVLLYGVVDRTGADPRRDRFVLDLHVPGDAGHAQASVRAVWALLARHYTLGLAATGSRNRLSFLPDDMSLKDAAAGSAWRLRFLVTRAAKESWPVRLAEIAPGIRGMVSTATLHLAGATDRSGQVLMLEAPLDTGKRTSLLAAGRDGFAGRPLLVLDLLGNKGAVGVPARPVEMVVGAALMRLAQLKGMHLELRALSPLFTYSQAPLEATLTLGFGGAMLKPVSQDPEIGFETLSAWLQRERPITVDLTASDDNANYQIHEVSGREQSRVLRIGITADKKNTLLPAVDAVVIDTNPFFVARVQAPAPAELDAGTPLAEYTDDAELSPEWTYFNPTGQVTLTLPPQAIGEELIKGKDSRGVASAAPVPGKTFDFRLSPVARMTMDLSDINLARPLAPWSLRRLFSQRPGVVGVKTERLQFELLYGLSTQIETRGLRLAENDAFIGRVPFSDDLGNLYRSTRTMPPPYTSRQAYAMDAARWIGQLLNRPAQLTLFRDPTDRGHLTVTDGVAFVQRPSRQTASPFDPDRPPANVLPSPPEPGTGAGRKLLRGGVDYMFESQKIAKEFWDDKVPGTGHVVGARFGALGGSGRQQAAFNQGKTLVLSDTTDGRINSVTLIRKGRIAVLWNHARHVIVYERTVRTAPRYRGKDGQPADFEGLAAVRKVREYIEITQPRRAFPDTLATTPINGPVLAATFDTIVIPVKSAWGRDTADGWVTALRGPLEVDEEQFYPSPRIFFELARAKDKGGGHVSQMAADPSQLYFFTSTHAEDTGDTDAWPAVPDIDYAVLGRPQPPSGARMARFGNAMQPDAPGHELGQRRFTIDLVPAEDGVNLLHGRNFDGIEARLANLTLSRGAPRPARELADAQRHAQAFGAVHADLSESLDEFMGRLRTLAVPGVSGQAPALLGKDLRDAAIAAVQAARKGIGDITVPTAAPAEDAPTWLKRQSDLAAIAISARASRWSPEGELGRQLAAAVDAIQDLGDPAEARARLSDALDHVGAQLRDQVEGARDVVDVALDSMATLLARLEAEAVDWAGGQQARLLAGIDRLEAQARDTTRKPETVLDALDSEFGQAWQSCTMLCDRLVRQAQAGLAEWFAGAVPGAWPGQEAFGRDMPADLGLAVEIWIDDCRLAYRESGPPDWERLRQLVEGFDLPAVAFDSARQLLQDLEEQGRAALDQARRAAGQAIEAAYDAIKARLATMPLDELRKAEAVLQGVFDDARTAFSGFQEAARQQLANLPGAFPGTVWADVVDKVASPQALRDQARAELDRLLQSLQTSSGIDTVLDLVQGHAASAQASLQALGQQFESEVLGKVGEWREQAAAMLEQPMSTVRMLASGPLTDTIETSRRLLGYYNDPAIQALATTPASALFNRTVGEVLNPLAVAMPFDRLRERLLPQLAKIRVADLFPSFAGLDMRFLLAALDIDDSDLERTGEYGWITMTHRFDKDRLTPSTVLDVDKSFDEEVDLFTLPPFGVRLNRPHFIAHSEVRPALRQQETYGSLTADWMIQLGGKTVVTIRGATLRFDGAGGFDFDMDANAVELDESLRFLTDALALMKPDGSGVQITPLLPGGISATLDLPLPDVGTGAFTLTNLSLHMHFGLLFAPRFEMRTGLWLARPERPFGLAILFLGGGGWFGVDLAYQPPSTFATKVSIGISAGAFVAVNFGVASGSAGVLFTAGLEFTHSSAARAGNGTAISIGLLVWGEFSILGIASAYLRMVLTVTQKPGGRMTGSGRVKVRIKICWCYTLKVSSPVTMPFQGGGSGAFKLLGAATPEERVERALQAYFANLDL